MPLAPGSRIGSFEIVALLGSGGMGEVYRARDTKLGREVAIKALPEAFARDPERLARFEREARLLASLNHPNVAALYGLEESASMSFLVLELVEGETLAARIRRDPLPPREVVRIGILMAAAIEAAHERGIIHRDLKPGNVMVTAVGDVKVLDFGLAKAGPVTPGPSGESNSPTMAALDGETRAGAIVGTTAYMSPEQLRSLPADRRSDIWAFGCVLFECCAGQPAFPGATASDVIAGILEREPDWDALPLETPARARDILRRCLRKRAEERPRDIRDVRLELVELVSGGARNGARERSIAVLPFENLSGPDDEYFADGVTDEILNVLSRHEGLRVAARASCFAFKGRREDLRAVGEKLDVATVLEGSVRRSGSRLRITVQLANASDGYQLWSERYDREMTDVFAVQDEIANAIAGRLRMSMRRDADRARARRGTRSLEAYELLLRGRAFQMKRGRFQRQAIDCFERAIQLDPGYAEAMAWLAEAYRLLGTFGLAPFSEVMPRARELAERALAIDPDLTEACSALGSVAAQYERDYGLAEEYWKRGLTIDPRHARIRCQRAYWAVAYLALSPEEGALEMRRSVEDDPMNSWVAGMSSVFLGLSGQHAASLREAERAVALDPESFWAKWNLMRAHAWPGSYEQALELAPELLMDSGRHPWALGTIAWTLARAGRPERARAAYDELEGRSRLEFVGPFWLAAAAAAAGRMDDAFRAAERAVQERDPLVILSRRYPEWDAIRTDPRYERVVAGVCR